MRTAEFEPSYAYRGVRTCSNNLVLLAERWTEAEAYRDAFEILSKAVSLSIDPPSTNRRLSLNDLADLERLVNDVKRFGTHFRTLEMAEQILRESQPRGAERARRSVQVPYDLSLGSHSYSHTNSGISHLGSYSDGFGLGSWGNGQEDGASVDLYQRAPTYLGLGDPWTDPLHYIYP